MSTSDLFLTPSKDQLSSKYIYYPLGKYNTNSTIKNKISKVTLNSPTNSNTNFVNNNSIFHPKSNTNSNSNNSIESVQSDITSYKRLSQLLNVNDPIIIADILKHKRTISHDTLPSLTLKNCSANINTVTVLDNSAHNIDNTTSGLAKQSSDTDNVNHGYQYGNTAKSLSVITSDSNVTTRDNNKNLPPKSPEEQMNIYYNDFSKFHKDQERNHNNRLSMQQQTNNYKTGPVENTIKNTVQSNHSIKRKNSTSTFTYCFLNNPFNNSKYSFNYLIKKILRKDSIRKKRKKKKKKSKKNMNDLHHNSTTQDKNKPQFQATKYQNNTTTTPKYFRWSFTAHQNKNKNEKAIPRKPSELRFSQANISNENFLNSVIDYCQLSEKSSSTSSLYVKYNTIRKKQQQYINNNHDLSYSSRNSINYHKKYRGRPTADYKLSVILDNEPSINNNQLDNISHSKPVYSSSTIHHNTNSTTHNTFNLKGKPILKKNTYSQTVDNNNNNKIHHRDESGNSKGHDQDNQNNKALHQTISNLSTSTINNLNHHKKENSVITANTLKENNKIYPPLQQHKNVRFANVSSTTTTTTTNLSKKQQNDNKSNTKTNLPYNKHKNEQLISIPHSNAGIPSPETPLLDEDTDILLGVLNGTPTKSNNRHSQYGYYSSKEEAIRPPNIVFPKNKKRYISTSNKINYITKNNDNDGPLLSIDRNQTTCKEIENHNLSYDSKIFDNSKNFSLLKGQSEKNKNELDTVDNDQDGLKRSWNEYLKRIIYERIKFRLDLDKEPRLTFYNMDRRSSNNSNIESNFSISPDLSFSVSQYIYENDTFSDKNYEAPVLQSTKDSHYKGKRKMINRRCLSVNDLETDDDDFDDDDDLFTERFTTTIVTDHSNILAKKGTNTEQ